MTVLSLSLNGEKSTFHEFVFNYLPENSKASFVSDLKCFSRYCQQMAIGENQLFDEIEQKGVGLGYFDYLYDRYARTTIERRMASLTKMIRIAKGNHYIPAYKSDAVIDNHMRLRLRQLPGANQKSPLRLNDALKLPLLDFNSSNKELRNQLVILMGLYTLCRASELLAITPNDLDFDKSTIFIRRAKNDQEGVGRYAPMSSRLKQLLREYLSRRYFEPNTPLIRRLTKYDTLSTPLSYKGIYKCIKEMCCRIYGDSTTYATHSLRIGAAVSMAENDVPLIEIIQAGGWKSSTQPVHYTRQANTVNKGMGRLV